MRNEHKSPILIKKTTELTDNKAIEAKITSYEEQSSRISIMYKQRHEYQMLFENDQIETRKRLKNNELIISRIEAMYKTSG